MVNKPRTLVTGGAKRLGSSICKTLAQHGHHPVIHYRHSHDEAKETAKQCRAFGVEADIIEGDFSTTSGLKSFLQEYTSRFPSTIHLINNVGNYPIGTTKETTVEIWEDLFLVNLLAPIELIRQLTPSLIEQRGCVVNLGVSGLQTSRSDNHTPAYTSLKLALLSLTKSWAKEFAAQGVTVNMVSPGILDITVNPPDPSRLPMGRMGTCDEVARVVAFLLEPASNYITGQNIEVGGGVRL